MDKDGNKTGGRQKGTPNKITRDIKEMILHALQAKGGSAYLQKQADKNPNAFMGLVGKAMPLQVKGSFEETGKIEVAVRYVRPETPIGTKGNNEKCNDTNDIPKS